MTDDPDGPADDRPPYPGSDGDLLALRALDQAKAHAWDRGLRRSAPARRRRVDAAEEIDLSDLDAADGSAEEPLTGVFGSGQRGGAPPSSAPADPPGAPAAWRPGPGLGWAGSGSRPSRRDPQPLGGLASRLVAQRGWSASVEVGAVVTRWAEIVGQQVAEHAVVESFDEGALVVRADSTAWATQLRLLLPQLERRIAEEVGAGVVVSLTVRGPGGPSWKHGFRSVRGGRGPRDTYG